jgi:predicted GIY-YIG superfamily endonuclease
VYYVYILASRKHGTLYLGVTRDLVRRVYEHKTKAVPGFTSRYDVRVLVLVRMLRRSYDRHYAREGHQEVAPRMENSVDRGNKSGMG